MSDFYGNLSSEALADDDNSEISEPDMNKIIADMDDLDANLFGSAAIKTSNAASTNLQTSSSHLKFESDSRPATTTKQDKPANKSRLLAELFGDSSDIYSASVDKPTSGRLPVSRGRTDTFDLISPRPKTSPEPPGIKDNWGSGYQPTSQPRERRRQAPASTSATSEDLWSKFLQPSSTEIKEDKPNYQKIDAKSDKSPLKAQVSVDYSVRDHRKRAETFSSLSPVRTKSPQQYLPVSNPDPIRLQSPTRSRRQPPPTPLANTRDSMASLQSDEDWSQPKVTTNPVPAISLEDQLLILKPHIEEMIANQIEKLEASNLQTTSMFQELESQVEELGSANQELQQTQATLRTHADEQQESLQELRERTEEEGREWKQKLRTLDLENKAALAAMEEQHSEQVAALHASIASLQRRLQESQEQQRSSEANAEDFKLATSRLISQQLSASLSSLRSEICEDLHATQAKVKALESQCSSLTLELLEQKETLGEQQAARLVRVEAKCRQLLNYRRPPGWEEDMELRVDQTETNFGSRLSHTNKQQARLGAWQEKQLTDLAEYVDQRLWSLYHQLEIQRKEVMSLGQRFVSQQASLLEPCTEAESLRKLLSDREAGRGDKDSERDGKLSVLETRVSATEAEGCRLSRLADRLCDVLQMWEMRHKSASRIEAESMQNLFERYNLAMIERSLDKR